jgi:hypothetical protein
MLDVVIIQFIFETALAPDILLKPLMLYNRYIRHIAL